MYIYTCMCISMYVYVYTCIEKNEIEQSAPRGFSPRRIVEGKRNEREKERERDGERERDLARKREGKYQAYFAHRQRTEFYNCTGLELIAKLIGVAMRVMLSMCAAFCAPSYRSYSKCEMDFECGLFHRNVSKRENFYWLPVDAVTNLSRPILVILMSFSMCKRKPRTMLETHVSARAIVPPRNIIFNQNFLSARARTFSRRITQPQHQVFRLI